MIDPWIDDRFATCGGTPHALATPTTKEVITDAAHRSAPVLWTPGHVSRTGRDGNTPGNCGVSVRSPWDYGPVMIVGIGVPKIMGQSGNLDVLNKWQSITPSCSRNTRKFEASVDGNLAYDGYSTSIFRKVLGQ